MQETDDPAKPAPQFIPHPSCDGEGANVAVQTELRRQIQDGEPTKGGEPTFREHISVIMSSEKPTSGSMILSRNSTVFLILMPPKSSDVLNMAKQLKWVALSIEGVMP